LGGVYSNHAPSDLPDFKLDDKVKDLFTITGRVGYLFDPSLLGYLKAGGAWAKVDSGIVLRGVLLGTDDNYGRFGWTVGAGAEWKFAKNWSAFGEYNYMDFGKRDVIYNGIVSYVMSSELKVQQAIVGVNYRF
jgi:outer membrane immunogenic protein